jgi:hypothetical protein
MAATLEVPSRTIRDQASRIEDLVQPRRAVRERALDDQGIDKTALAERRQRWYREIEDAVLDLSNVLPQGPEDYDARKLFEFLIELRRAVSDDPCNHSGDVELATARMLDVVRRISRRIDHERLDDPQLAAASIFEAMSGVPARDLAKLLGVSQKTVGTWRTGGAVERNAARVIVVAQLLTYLRASMTPRGLMMWFEAARPQLGDQTPLELLKRPADAREPLIALARGARAQLGS